jgi:UDPglucose--hexose-1-phosphate uridylyltransferase
MNSEAPDNVHRRRNPLNGRWVLVSPHRNARPWRGEIAASTPRSTVAHDPECHLCPGNPRVGGATNPRYDGPYVFDNDFPALFVVDPIERPASILRHDPLFVSEGAEGRCRVICYSPDHDRSMARLSTAERRQVVDCWAAESAELGARHSWVQIFENKGEMMGCSNPHPH